MYTIAQQQQGTLSLCEEVKQQANTRKLNWVVKMSRTNFKQSLTFLTNGTYISKLL